MSRGLSQQQRKLLTLIEAQPRTIWELVRLAGRAVNPCRYEAARRAVAGLVSRGLVAQLQWGWPKRFCTPAAATEEKRHWRLVLLPGLALLPGRSAVGSLIEMSRRKRLVRLQRRQFILESHQRLSVGRWCETPQNLRTNEANSNTYRRRHERQIREAAE